MSRTTSVPDDFDLILAAWFESDAGAPEPAALFDNVIETTSHTRPLPTWRLPERWIPMDLALRTTQPFGRLAPILLVILLTIAVVAAALIIGSQRQPKLPPPFGLAANGQIVFVSEGHVHLADPDGTSNRSVTSGELFASSPIFSPDGTRFTYNQASIDADGETTAADVVVASADGSNPVVIDRGAHALTNASWSADGQWLAFVRYETADPSQAAGVPFPRGHLIVVRPDGSGRTDLGDLGLDPWGPSWSPDGTLLAFANFDGSLYVVGRDGTGLRELTTEDYPDDGLGMKSVGAEWSPDGTKLLFAAGTAGGPDSHLYVVGLDGAPEAEFAPNTRNQRDAAWSPDGKYVAFMRQGVGTGPVVAITDPEGNLIRALPGYYGWYTPAWSPDGNEIAVLDDRPGPNDIEGGQAEIVILDAWGDRPPVRVATPVRGTESLPDRSLTWQRLALP
jgi:Tol biopolymer transport system component